MQRIFGQIWKNIYIRYVFLGLVVLVVFLLIFRKRYAIFNFFDQIFQGVHFDDPYSWQDNVYGFEEDLDGSKRLFLTAVADILEESADVYDIDIDNPYFKEEVQLAKDFDNIFIESYEDDGKVIRQKQTLLSLLSKYFEDLKKFCKPFIGTNSYLEEWNYQEKLKQRTLGSKKKPFVFAIKSENTNDIRNYLRKLDENYFSLALQKKPDALAIIHIRSALFEATCQTTKRTELWKSAVLYFEFKKEKEIFVKDGKFNKEKYDSMKPDTIFAEVQKKLAEDENYHFFLKRFYRSSSRKNSNIEWSLKLARNAYLLTKGDDALQDYLGKLLKISRTTGSNIDNVEILLANAYLIESSNPKYKAYMSYLLTKARSEGSNGNELIYSHLLHGLETKELYKNSSYIYILSEVAYRAGRLKDSRNHLNKIINSKSIRSHDLRKAIGRLDLMLKLSKY